MAVVETGLRHAPLPQQMRHESVLALVPILLAACAVLWCLALRGGGTEGWQAATETVWRGGVFLFAAALVAAPVAELFPRVRELGRAAPGLALGFAGVYAIFLCCLAVPDLLGLADMPFPERVFCVTSGLALAACAAGAGRGGWQARAARRLAAIYFWWAYFLPALDHLTGPHRPDGYFGLSALVLLGALFICFAGDWMRIRRARTVGLV